MFIFSMNISISYLYLSRAVEKNQIGGVILQRDRIASFFFLPESKIK